MYIYLYICFYILHLHVLYLLHLHLLLHLLHKSSTTMYYIYYIHNMHIYISGCISEPQRGPTVGGGIMVLRRHVAFSVLPRRLPPGSRLRLYFRAPERANSRRDNHTRMTAQTDFSALQTSPSRISAPAVFPSPREGQQ